MSEIQEYKYKAFISYSHKDEKWGRWLHRGIEGYRTPRSLVGRDTLYGPVPKRLYPLFRDREELPTASDLSEIIDQALIDSSHLIVICSPNSAKSQWVNEEVKTFKKLGKQNRILCLIVDGEPNADSKFDLGLEECFPPAVKVAANEKGNLTDIQAEPIAADARDGKDGKSNAMLKVLAGLLGVGFDELNQRDLRRKKRRVSAIACFSILLTAIMMLMTYNALKLKGAALLSYESSINQYNFLSSIFVSSLHEADLRNFENGDIDLLIYLLQESSDKLTDEEEKLTEKKLYGRDLLYRLNLHSTLGDSFSAFDYNEDAIYHYRQAINILRQSKERKIVRYQWGIIPIYEPKLPSWESEIEVYERKIKLIEIETAKEINITDEVNEYKFIQFTKEGFDALRDEETSGLHKKGTALSYELMILHKKSIKENQININEFEEIRDKALGLYPSKVAQLFWTKKFKRMAESRLNDWMSIYYNIVGITYLNLALNGYDKEEKYKYIKESIQNLEKSINIRKFVDYKDFLEGVELIEESNAKENQLFMVGLYLELARLMKLQIEGVTIEVNSIKEEILSKENEVLLRDNKKVNGIYIYEDWIRCKRLVSYATKDMNLYRLSQANLLEYHKNNTRSSSDDILTAAWGLFRVSLISGDITKINNAVDEMKNLQTLNDENINYRLRNIGSMSHYLTNKINKSIVVKNRMGELDFHFVENYADMYKLVNPFKDVDYFNAYTNKIGNKVYFRESGFKRGDIELFKFLHSDRNIEKFKKIFKKEMLFKHYNVFQLSAGNSTLGIDGHNMLEILMSNPERAEYIVRMLNKEELLEFQDATPLMFIALFGYNNLIDVILDKGANIKEKNRAGQSVLHYSVIGGNETIVEKVLSKEVNINSKDLDGRSSLFYAVFNEKIDIVKLLIKNGANVNSANKEGTILDAIEKESKKRAKNSKSRQSRKQIRDIIRYLKRAGAKNSSKIKVNTGAGDLIQNKLLEV